MQFKLRCLLVSSMVSGAVFAAPDASVTGNSDPIPVKITKESEAAKMNQYSGTLDTAPKGQTVSSAGGAIEFAPSNSSQYVFYGQTLSNDIFYEIRAYNRLNYNAANPSTPNIPASNISNPDGYGFVEKLGYNFHTNDRVDISPYVRLGQAYDMGPVYNDTGDNGQSDYINSYNWTILLGSKFSFKMVKNFTPYFDLSSGFVYNQLSGHLPAVPGQGGTDTTGTLNQWQTNYEIGMSAKLSEHIVLTPYWIYQTTANYSSPGLDASINNGGLGQSNTTGTQQSTGIKLSVNW